MCIGEEGVVSLFFIGWMVRTMRIGGLEFETVISFYKSTAWRKMRERILKRDHYECQLCKVRGRYTKAQTVHHTFHVREYPHYALSSMVDGKRNLISLCKECHNEVHPEKHHVHERKEALTPERW